MSEDTRLLLRYSIGVGNDETPFAAVARKDVAEQLAKDLSVEMGQPTWVHDHGDGMPKCEGCKGVPTVQDNDGIDLCESCAAAVRGEVKE
jgi:hypothetical protein